MGVTVGAIAHERSNRLPPARGMDRRHCAGAWILFNAVRAVRAVMGMVSMRGAPGAALIRQFKNQMSNDPIIDAILRGMAEEEDAKMRELGSSHPIPSLDRRNPCCMEMNKQLDYDNMFYVMDHPPDSFLWRHKDAPPAPTMYVLSDGGNGGFAAIQYCPFCGAHLMAFQPEIK